MSVVPHPEKREWRRGNLCNTEQMVFLNAALPTDTLKPERILRPAGLQPETTEEESSMTLLSPRICSLALVDDPRANGA